MTISKRLNPVRALSAASPYDYDGRYLLEVMGRYDGSWKFPPTKRWGFFPSVSAGWRITEESWWSERTKTLVLGT